uniref:Uncharacterized protein n=1 Tax=Rhizophora mucronata TaxID=61149 RepID=A0A2P2JSN8_RHIMU
MRSFQTDARDTFCSVMMAKSHWHNFARKHVMDKLLNT